MSAEHAPQNAMGEPGEIAAFYDGCSDLMRRLLDELHGAPGVPRPFPQIEDAMGWPRRRIASVLGGVFHLRTTRFGGRRPYRFLDARDAPSRRWEMWMDADQAAAARAAADERDQAESAARRASRNRRSVTAALSARR